MLLKKRFLFSAVLALLICVGQAAAGPNANAVLSLDLIADGGAGNQKDDGVISGTVSGQGTKIAVEVFAKGVTTPLIGVSVEFDFDASVLTYVKAENSAFFYHISEAATALFAGDAPVTLPASGFLARAEFSTVADVTGREFSIGIKKVELAESPTSSDVITTTAVITFNATATPSPDFDGDGMVGIPDFLMFVNVFGSSQGDGKYEAKYDLDGNGEIGIPDFLIFVDNFGKEVPPSGGGGDRDRAALVALYNATGGDNWERKTNWLSDKPIGEWQGVVTNEHGQVTELHLSENQLTGSIPDEIGNLSNLQFMVLGYNDLTGPIPESIGNLTNLRHLSLNNNQLSGPIPDSVGNLSKLTDLVLENNDLSGPIPSSIGNLSKLNWLALNNNQLSGPIPSSIGNLTKLTLLMLTDNQLSGAIPDSLGNLVNLQVVFLSGNPNLCMPASLKDWKFYNIDGVSKCKAVGSVEGDRAALVVFYNATDGDNWKDKTNWLSDKPLGQWHGVEINAQGRVISLSLSSNQLTGAIPASIGTLTKINWLDLRDNQLTGSIPESIGNLINVVDLYLHNNQLSGAVPASIANLTNLIFLGLETIISACRPVSKIGNSTTTRTFQNANRKSPGAKFASRASLCRSVFAK